MNKIQKDSQLIQKEHEKLYLEKIADFVHTESEAWKKLTERFGPKINQDELSDLAQVVSRRLNIELTREDKRRKRTLVKWFQDHLDEVWPYIEQHIEVTDIDGNTVKCEQSTE